MKVRIHYVVIITRDSVQEVTPEAWEGAMTPSEIAAKEREYIEESPEYFFEGMDSNDGLDVTITVEEVT